MSLIICPECQREVSSRAATCPHCGVKIAGNVKRCPVCNSVALMDAEQCPSCKTPFVVIASQAETASSTASETVPEMAPEIASEIAPGPALTLLSEAATTDDAAEATAAEDAGGTDDSAATPPAEPAVPGKKPAKSGAPWWLLILGILAIAIAGFFYWENQNQEEAEERAYTLLENCNDPLNYEDFIARFPGSKHIEEVRARLQELHREDAEWLKISSNLSVKELQAFVDEHATSPYKKQALQKIDSLDWREADRKGTSAAYDAYIAKHDNGEFLDQAYSAREAARNREERARRDSITAAQDTTAATEAAPDVTP